MVQAEVHQIIGIGPDLAVLGGAVEFSSGSASFLPCGKSLILGYRKLAVTWSHSVPNSWVVVMAQ